MDGTLDSVKTLAAYEASCGVTSIAPATMTMPTVAIKKSINSALEFKQQLMIMKHLLKVSTWKVLCKS